MRRLVAIAQPIEMSFYFDLGVDNRLKPSELTEAITHLAFYAGWPNAMSAVAAAKDVFTARRITPDQLFQASLGLLPPRREGAEAQRALKE